MSGPYTGLREIDPVNEQQDPLVNFALEMANNGITIFLVVLVGCSFLGAFAAVVYGISRTRIYRNWKERRERQEQERHLALMGELLLSLRR